MKALHTITTTANAAVVTAGETQVTTRKKKYKLCNKFHEFLLPRLSVSSGRCHQR